MSMSSQDIRDDFTNHLIELLKRDGFEDKLLILDSEPDTFFIENYEKTIEAIKTRLNIDIINYGYDYFLSLIVYVLKVNIELI